MNQNWRDDANCIGQDINIFFIDRGDSQGPVKKAIEICRACIVQEQCLNFALTNSIKTGIYGGMSPNQRFAYKRIKKNAIK